MLGRHMVSHWSKLQANVALSSGEAELIAGVKCLSEMLGIVNLCSEMNISYDIRLSTDASVCKSILSRHGSGRIKHLTTKQLWVQGAIETYKVKVVKIPRNVNSADLFTHPCTVEDFRAHLKRLEQRTESFRTPLAHDSNVLHCIQHKPREGVRVSSCRHTN